MKLKTLPITINRAEDKEHFEIWFGEDFMEIRDGKASDQLEALFSPNDCKKIRALTGDDLPVKLIALSVPE
jgi:hypothetical protein